MTRIRRGARFVTVGLIAVVLLASCGGDDQASDDNGASAATEPAGREGIVLAANPWAGSIADAYVAKAVLETQLGTSVEIIEIDENATWVGMDSGEIDAVLEVWPSRHVADYETYVDGKQSVVDLGPLGPMAKIGWYVPTFVVEEHPELATWEGFKDHELAKLFDTDETTGELGQFTMGDPSFVTFDEQIIANLELSLEYLVVGSENTLISALDKAFTEQEPILVQFWRPHWLHARYDLTEVKLPDFTEDCRASAAASDGQYHCDYQEDALYKAASAGLEDKNPAAFAFLSRFQLTAEQQNQLGAEINDGTTSPDEIAAAWVAANPDVVAGWLA